MRNSHSRVFISICFFAALVSVASTIELKGAADLSKTLENTNVLINAYNKRGDLLRARGDLAFDASTGRFTNRSAVSNKIDDKKSNGSGEIMDDETQLLEDKTIVELADKQKEGESVNLAKSKNYSSTLSGAKSLSSSDVLSPISQPTQSVLGLAPSSSGISSSKSYSLSSKDLDGLSYGDFTRRAIDAVSQKNDQGNQGFSSGGIASSGGAFQPPRSFNLNDSGSPSSGLSLSSNSKNESVNLSKSDIESYGDAFSGYDSLSNAGSDVAGLNNSNSKNSVVSDSNKQNSNHSEGQDSSQNSKDNKKPAENTASKVNDSEVPKTPKAPVNCQSAKDAFYAKFNNTGSYTLKETVTDKDGKQRQQYCIKPQKNDLFDVYSGLGNLEESCSQEVGAVFYGSDAESACIWVDAPSARAPGTKTHNLPDLFDNSSSENSPMNGPAESGNQGHVK
jgi:hypothetical protein